MPGLTAAQLFARVSVAGAEKSVRDLQRVGHQVDRTQRTLDRGRTGFATMGKGAGQLAAGLLRVGAVAGGTLVGAIGLAAKRAGDFQADLLTINTIAKQDEKGLGRLGDGIRRFSAESGADLADLTGSYYDLLSAGVKVADAQGLLEQSFRLGRAALGTTNESVDVLTTALNSYAGSAMYAGRSTADLARMFSDQLAQAVEDGKLKLTDIAGSFADVAPVAAQMGIGVNEIAAAYGFLTARGVQAAEVTTQMNRAMIELLKPGSDLEKLQKRLHKNYADLARTKGLVPTLVEMRKDAERLGVPFQDLFGRLEGYKFALATTSDAGAGFAAEQGRINASVKDGGETMRQFNIRNQGFAVSLQRLKMTALDAAISFGEGLTPAIGRLADKAAAFVRDHRDDFKRWGEDIGKAIDGIDWGKVQDGAKLLLGLAQRVYDVVKLIPVQFQVAGAGLLGLNTLSGGLLGAGATNIGKGLLQVVFQRGQTPVNPLWVASVTGGVGTGAGGAVIPTGRNPSLLGSLLTKLGGLGVGIGGSALLGLGTNASAPTEVKAALGAVGGAGMIGGGALVAGPAGALVGSLLAVNQTLQDTTAATTAQASQIHMALSPALAGKSRAELETALAATQTGIRDIQGAMFGLGGLVHGGAVDELRAQQGEIVAALDELPKWGPIGDYLGQIASNTGVMARRWTTQLTPEGIRGRAEAKGRRPTESGVSGTLLKDVARRLGSGQRDVKVGMVALIHAVRTWKPPAPKPPVVKVTVAPTTVTVNVRSNLTVSGRQVASALTRYRLATGRGPATAL